MDLASIKKFFASLTLQKLVPVILIVVIGLLLVKLLLKLFDRVLERSRLERTMFSFLRAAMRALLYTILVLVAASSLGVDVTSLVAILSVVSLAISLAVQNALSNVVGSVTLLTTHPFHVGDFVEIGSDSGTVEEISVSYTKLATVDGKLYIIPVTLQKGHIVAQNRLPLLHALLDQGSAGGDLRRNRLRLRRLLLFLSARQRGDQKRHADDHAADDQNCEHDQKPASHYIHFISPFLSKISANSSNVTKV